MNQRTLRKSAWLVFGVLGVFTRGLPGWEPLLAGSPPSEWLPAITLALLWGALAFIGFVGTVYGADSGESEGFEGYQWGMVAVFVVIPIIGLTFLSLGYSLVQVGIDIVGAPAVLALWVYVTSKAK